MGRELASTAARWIHLDELGVRPRLVHVCDVNPRDARLVRAAGCRAAPQRRLARGARRPRGRGRLHRRPPPPARRAVRGRARGRQAPARREAVRHRPGRQRDDHGRGRRAPRPARALLVGDAVLPGRPGGLALDRRGRVRPPDRGALALPALERPRSRETDQLEAPRRDERRLRLPRRPRHARTAPAAAGRLGAARRARRARPTSSRSARTAAAGRSRATPRTTPSCCAGPSTKATSSRCGSRRSASRPAT